MVWAMLRRIRETLEGRLGVRGKLIAVLIVSLTPALVLGGMWAKRVEEDRRFTAKEIDGLAYLRTVWPVLSYAAQDRTHLKPEYREALQEARIAHDAAMDAALESRELRVAIDDEAGPQAVVAAAHALLRQIGDGSNLILDPELASFYAMSLSVDDLPDLALAADDFGAVRQAFESETDRRLAPGRAFAAAGALSAAVEDVRLSHRAMARADRLAAARLSPALAKVTIAAERLRQAALALANVGEAEPSAAALAEVSTQERQVQGVVDALWRASAAELYMLLEARERRLESQLHQAIGLSIVLIVFGFVFVSAAGRSVRVPLERLAAIATRMAQHNDTTLDVPYLTYRSEVGAIARGTAVFREALIRADMLASDLAAERSALEERVALRTRELAQAAEAAQAASVAKSAFLATMSHEIRTPLNGVLGMAEALRREELAPSSAEMVETIIESGRSLQFILNDVLDLSKIEAGKLTLEDAPFDLGALAQTVVGLYRETAEAKGLTLRLSVSQEALGWYRGDATRLRQVLQNLLSNAVKFTERGHVTLHLDAETADAERAAIRFAVSDTGIGIAQDALAHLFQPFSQADATTTRRFGGTGLGLSLVREIVKAMGGEVTVESQEGVGSRFCVLLPLARASASALGDDDLMSPAAQADAAPLELRVLAADDHPVNRKVLDLLLRQVGIDPVLAEDGAAAVAAAESARFDLILMDLHMPELDGLGATKAIRAGAGPNAETPIIALTADAMPETIARCFAAGMAGHVAKPIEPDVLFAAMERALEGAEAQGAPAQTAAAAV
jgi:signal transduction histidine kinase/AmiR/NasT family two-component response regulator